VGGPRPLDEPVDLFAQRGINRRDLLKVAPNPPVAPLQDLGVLVDRALADRSDCGAEDCLRGRACRHHRKPERSRGADQSPLADVNLLCWVEGKRGLIGFLDPGFIGDALIMERARGPSPEAMKLLLNAEFYTAEELYGRLKQVRQVYDRMRDLERVLLGKDEDGKARGRLSAARQAAQASHGPRAKS
jgi:hypothetical protein